MEYFFNVNTGRVEQRPVEQNFYPGTNVPIKSIAEIAANQNVVLPNQTLFDPRSLQSIFPTNVQKGITASSAAIPFGTPVDIQQGFTQNTPSDQGTNFQFLPSANEADETDVVETKTGIAKLFDFLSNFIPGVGLLKRLGDVPGGIRSLNQRLRNTDFGRSKNLMDFIDMKKYGGYEGREDARAATMAQARGIQKKIDRGEFGTRDRSIDRGRGSIPSRSSPTTSRRDTSSSSSYSQASYDRRR